MKYTKDRVQFHGERFSCHELPAVLVKVYHFGLSCEDVKKEFACSDKIAEKALEWCWNLVCHGFWNSDWVGILKEIFKEDRLKVYQEGRMGGWLVVDGLPSLEEWNAILLSRWRRFEKYVKATVDGFVKDKENLLDLIKSNRWAEENAEEYNYIDVDGESVCLSDVPRCLHCKGGKIT